MVTTSNLLDYGYIPVLNSVNNSVHIYLSDLTHNSVDPSVYTVPHRLVYLPVNNSMNNSVNASVHSHVYMFFQE